MKIVVSLPAPVTKEQAEQYAKGIVAFVPGARAEVVLPKAATDPRLVVKAMEDTSRMVVANWLGQPVAKVGPLEAAMCMTLLAAEHVFIDSKSFHAALQEQWPCWQGQSHQVRAVYANLKKKLKKSQAFAPRGRYGFLAKDSQSGSGFVGLGVF